MRITKKLNMRETQFTDLKRLSIHEVYFLHVCYESQLKRGNTF